MCYVNQVSRSFKVGVWARVMDDADCTALHCTGHGDGVGRMQGRAQLAS